MIGANLVNSGRRLWVLKNLRHRRRVATARTWPGMALLAVCVAGFIVVAPGRRQFDGRRAHARNVADDGAVARGQEAPGGGPMITANLVNGGRRLSVLKNLRPRGYLAAALTWLGMGLLAVCVAGLIFVAIAPRVFGLHMVIVEGKSMEPTIHYGALAIVKDVNPAKVKVGDVVEFNAPETHWVTTHRVVAIAADHKSFTTRGDANNSADLAPLPASDIRGQFLFSIPEVGNAIRWLHTRNGLLTAVLIPGGAIILLELLSIAKELRRRDEPLASSQ